MERRTCSLQDWGGSRQSLLLVMEQVREVKLEQEEEMSSDLATTADPLSPPGQSFHQR